MVAYDKNPSPSSAKLPINNAMPTVSEQLAEMSDDELDEGRIPQREKQGFDPAIQQIRGSALLFAGRPIALVINLAAQVLTVRYLTKLDFGAFMFAFCIMETAIVLAGFGMGKAIARFASIYDEQGDQRRLAGVVTMALIAVIGIGLSVVVLAFGLVPFLSHTGVISPLSTTLLLTLILLAPIKALDDLHESLASVFSGARLVFLKRILLVPLFRLCAVIVVILASGDVFALAVSHVIAGAVSTLLYGVMLWRLLLRRAVLKQASKSALASTYREFLRFSATLFSSDLTLLIRGVLIIVLLEVLHSTASVADYGAVLPLARLSELVVISFSVLFIPTAARLFSSQNTAKLNDLYWQTSGWVTVLTFPLFAFSYAAADPIVVLLFGHQYSESGCVLALLAFSFYFNSALGFNSRMLKVVGKVRLVLLVDLLALAVALGMYFTMIPRYGALGAAIAVSASTIVHAIAKQTALIRWTDVWWCSWRYAKVYVCVAFATVVLTLWQWLVTPTLMSGFVLVVLCWLGVLVVSRDALVVHQVFPELQQLQLLRRWFQAT